MKLSDFRQNEVMNYWRACQQARHGDDRAMGYNDLYGIASNTDWPLLAKMSANALTAPEALALP